MCVDVCWSPMACIYVCWCVLNVGVLMCWWFDDFVCVYDWVYMCVVLLCFVCVFVCLCDACLCVVCVMCVMSVWYVWYVLHVWCV